LCFAESRLKPAQAGSLLFVAYVLPSSPPDTITNFKPSNSRTLTGLFGLKRVRLLLRWRPGLHFGWGCRDCGSNNTCDLHKSTDRSDTQVTDNPTCQDLTAIC